jgi:YD repeat-containing protein
MVTTTLDNGQSSYIAYAYADTCTPRIASKKEYGFTGSLLRETDETYLTSASDNTNLCQQWGLSGNSWTNGFGVLSWSDVYLQGNHHIADLPASVTVYGPGGCCSSPIAQTNYTYDSTPLSTTSGTAGNSVLGLPTHDDANFGSWMTLRGNPTVISQMTGSGTFVATKTNYYNILGEIVKSVDANGNATTFDHTDSWNDASCISVPEFAYPTTVTNALGQQSKTVYNSCDGSIYSVQDQNDINASRTGIVYTYDGLQRVTNASFPDGGDTAVCYGTPNCYSGPLIPEVITTAVTATPSPSQISSTTLDGLGRTVTTKASNNATVTTAYDSRGRVHTVSNPYFSTSDLTYGLTTYAYDALNRTTSQVDSDGTNKQTWSYSGPTVTYTDENGNQWQRTSDALGRLIMVKEPSGASQTATMETDYGYDTLNNLLTVTQWGGTSGSVGAKTRSFTYDSLSRLVAASNPENAPATSPPSLACSGASGTSWTTCYGYDLNGNLTSKTDNRNVTIGYKYDALNRMLSKSYSDGTTPYSCYQYDASGTTNGIGRLAAEWTVPGSQSGGCTATAPTILTMRTIIAYDAIGRILSERQCTPNASGPGNCTTSSPNPFALSYLYDLAGNLTAYTNGVSNVPSVGSIAFGLQYDGAGRLQNLSSSWNPATGSSGSPLSLFTADPPNAYTAFGAIQNMILGNSIFVNKTYDNRLRTTSETATHP